MILYNYFRSSASYRVRLALHYKSVSFEYHPIHLLQNKQNSPDYKKLNPMAQVPCLIDGSLTLNQSIAIIEYLEQTHPEPALLPKDPVGQGLVRQFCEIINCTQPYQNLSTLKYLELDLGLSAEQRQKWLERWLLPSFEAIEDFLISHSGPYCYQEKFSMADCFLIPQVFTAQRFNIPLEKFKNLLKIEQHCQKLPHVIKAHPLAQIDTPPELKTTKTN